MIVLDTNVLLWRNVMPGRISRRAASTLQRERQVVVPSFCFWEIAMLVARGRFVLPVPFEEFCAAVADDERTVVHDITPAIAMRAARLTLNRPMDPADQIIAATALELDAPLLTSDERLHGIAGLRTVW